MFFLLAALGGFFWALVIILDCIAVKNIFTHPLQALVITCLVGMWGFGILGFVDWEVPELMPAILATLGGIVLWISYYFYYKAMDITDEVSELAAWDAAHPMLIAFLGVPLGLALAPSQWIGLLIISISIVIFQWHKNMWQPPSNIKVTLFHYRSLLFVNALCMALTYLLMSIAARQANSYWDVYGFYIAGITTGLVVLLSSEVRKSFHGQVKRLCSLWWLFGFMEICNVIAPFCITFASTRIHPAAAAALGATFPVYVAIAGPIARKFGASENDFPRSKHLWLRLTALICLAGGAGLLQI